MRNGCGAAASKGSTASRLQGTDRGGARRGRCRLRGSFSIVVIRKSEPDKLVAAKTATPMVLGYGEGENFIASDIPALLEHTRNMLVMEDGELAEVLARASR